MGITRNIIPALLLAAFCFLSACTNVITEDKVLQDGVVRDMLTGRPIAGAKITMLQHSFVVGDYREFSQGRGKVCPTLKGKPVKTAVTDKNGYYHIYFDKPKYQLGTDRTYDVWYIIVSAPEYDDFCEDIYSRDPHKKFKMADIEGRMRDLNIIELTKGSPLNTHE